MTLKPQIKIIEDAAPPIILSTRRYCCLILGVALCFSKGWLAESGGWTFFTLFTLLNTYTGSHFNQFMEQKCENLLSSAYLLNQLQTQLRSDDEQLKYAM